MYNRYMLKLTRGITDEENDHPQLQQQHVDMAGMKTACNVIWHLQWGAK